MSEFMKSDFEQNWPVSQDITDHTRYAQGGVSEIEQRLILPEDARWQIAYGALVQGGSASAVLAEGEPGAGKTAFGNIVIGGQYRTDIASTDTPETLEGYLRPTDGKFNAGKMPLNEADARLFLNEISHLRDTGPLHKYWDDGSLVINGRTVDLENAPMYATTNFSDGGRVKKLDSAIRSRVGLTVLAGDNAEAIAHAIQGNDLGQQNDTRQTGLVPGSKERAFIQSELMRRNPLARSAGAFMAESLKQLNASGLFAPINTSDARIGQGWQQAVRAQRFIEGGEGQIKPIDLKNVAALALGSVMTLSQKGASEFMDRMGKMDSLTPLEKAVIARRVGSLIVYEAYLASDPDAALNVKDSLREQHMNMYSYANSNQADTINGMAMDVVLPNVKAAQGGQHEPKSRKLFGRRSR